MAYFEDTSTSHNITTDAGFRAWAQAVHDGLDAVGVVQTADTGQIDLETVSTPASNNSSAGYEIWRFDDASQSADPIFFRIEYGRGGAASRPRLVMAVGTGSDGSGSLVNPNTALTLAPATTSTDSEGYIYVSFVEEVGLTLVSYRSKITGSGTGMYLLIERLRRYDTAARITGAIGVAGAASSSSVLGRVRNAGVWIISSPPGIVSGSSPSEGEKVLGYFRLLDGGVFAPLRGLLLARSGALAEGDSGPVEVGSDVVTYRMPLVETLTSFGSPSSDAILPHEA